MVKVFLSDKTTYVLKKDEVLSCGIVGVYIWKEKVNNYPPVKFYVYGYVQKIENTNITKWCKCEPNPPLGKNGKCVLCNRKRISYKWRG